MSILNIENTVYNTPLVRLKYLPGETSNTILVKLEGNNTAGSVKDRPLLDMILKAEAGGEIRAGKVLIEATSGNTGIALANEFEARKPACALVADVDLTTFKHDMAMLTGVAYGGVS
ncbi:MAG: pyridoxal-phosphate dependent enzyme [Xanthomonadales bacterium]|nr:pyridoxal-phosphate dependent enzyme [Xanthomonadales bacterium]